MKKYKCDLSMAQFIGHNLNAKNIPFEIFVKSFSDITIVIEDQHAETAQKICKGWF